MRLYDCATVIRSKNAGPLVVTIDLMFGDRDMFDRVLASECLTCNEVARLYGVDAESVQICPFESVCTIKVSLPRPGASSGAPGDCDVYGCQQHFPLANMEVW